MKPSQSQTKPLSLTLCFICSIVEGADNGSMALAAPRLAPEFGLGPADVGLVLSASLLGLMIGALTGGGLSDRYGRKSVLLASLVILGAASFWTAFASVLSTLVLARFCVGLGLGAAFPILISIAAESSSAKSRARAISLVYCAQPLGGVLLGMLVGTMGDAMHWRQIFYLGGIAPLILIPLLAFFLPESEDFKRAKQEHIAATSAVSRFVDALFGQDRTVSTILLWIASAATLAVVYLMLNWIPSLTVGKGLTPAQGAIASTYLNIGGTLGIVIFGVLIDRGLQRGAAILSYSGLLVAVSSLVVANRYYPILLASAGTGFFMLGSQLILYAMAAAIYPTLRRGTGVGAAVGVGRIGAVIAPIAAGLVLAMGHGPATVIALTVPCVLIAGVTVWALNRRSVAINVDATP